MQLMPEKEESFSYLLVKTDGNGLMNIRTIDS